MPLDSRRKWGSIAWLLASVLFAVAAWQQPSKRLLFLALAVVFGIFGVASLRGEMGGGPKAS